VCVWVCVHTFLAASATADFLLRHLMLIGLKAQLFEGTGAESLRDTSEQAGVQGNWR
jgi:hypothetical protein